MYRDCLRACAYDLGLCNGECMRQLEHTGSKGPDSGVDVHSLLSIKPLNRRGDDPRGAPCKSAAIKDPTIRGQMSRSGRHILALLIGGGDAGVHIVGVQDGQVKGRGLREERGQRRDDGEGPEHDGGWRLRRWKVQTLLWEKEHADAQNIG